MLVEQDRPIWSQMSFAAAEENFHAGARDGIEANVYWPGVGEVPVTELVLRRLLPMAHEGLERWGVDAADRDRLLGIDRAALPEAAQRRRVAGGDVPPALRGRQARPRRRAARDDRALPRPDALQRAGRTPGRSADGARARWLWLALLAAGGGGGDADARRRRRRRRRCACRPSPPGSRCRGRSRSCPTARALVTERPGRVRLLDARAASCATEPVAEVAVSALGRGRADGPRARPGVRATTGLVYLYFTTAEGLKLERWRFDGRRGWRARRRSSRTSRPGRSTTPAGSPSGPTGGSTSPPATPATASSRRTTARSTASTCGSTAEQYRGDGEVRPEIVSKGHRNPQGFDWEPGTGRLISTEHGPSGGDGPQGFDEVNEIREGGNYGWPEAFGDDHEGFDAPLRVYEEAIAPVGRHVRRRARARRGRGDYLFADAARRGAAPAAAATATEIAERRGAARGRLRPAAHASSRARTATSTCSRATRTAAARRPTRTTGSCASRLRAERG